jgi:hypothetical protein
MLLLDLVREIEEESTIDATSTRAALGLLESDSIQSEEKCTQLLFGLCNAAFVYQELTQSKFLSALEEDLDNMPEPPPIRRPPFLTGTRTRMMSPKPFRVVI